MGSLFKPSVPAAPTPPPETKYNYRDEISGTEQVRQENPDGSVTMVTRALPLSPEEQAAKDELSRIIQDTTKRYEDLTTNYDIDLIPGLRDTIDAFRTGQQRNLDKAYSDRTNVEEKALARYGVEDSTAGRGARADRGRDYSDSELQIGEQGRLLENDIRQQEIANTQSLFSLANGQTQQNFANQLQGIQLGQANTNTNSQLAQQRNLAIYNGGLNQQNLGYQANQAGMNNLATTIGTAAMLGGGVYGAGGITPFLQKVWK